MNLIARNINSSSDELGYNFEFNHDTPSSKYVTENQFKDVVRGSTLILEVLTNTLRNYNYF